MMKKIVIALMLTIGFLTLHAQGPTPLMPSFKFYTSANAGFTRTQIPANKQTFIMFFDGTCGHCQKVMTALAKRNKELAGVNVYLVSLDEFRTINYFMENYGKSLIGMKNVTLLQDKDRIFIPLFKPTKYPAMFLYSADKRLKIYSSEETDVVKIFSMLKS